MVLLISLQYIRSIRNDTNQAKRFANNFSHYVCCLFTFFLVSFELETCLILMKSSVLIYSFATCVFESQIRIHYLRQETIA